MNDLWNALAQQIYSHLAAIEEAGGAAVAALCISGIFAIPEKFPGLDLQAWWSWMRDTLQGAVPMKFQKANHPNPQPTPAEPEKDH